ncbi:MAG: hypothetical protein IPK76_18450 [Lewinellaceae bacterium]|nr:hypothetical protein [Lewinellaceae bacterium]
MTHTNTMMNISTLPDRQKETSADQVQHVPENTNIRFGSYEGFLKACLDQGYRFCLFPEIDTSQAQIALRHDIDFDTAFALQSAKIESGLGIKSTYFFLLRSNFYNPFSPQDHENILMIRELGHQISIHFDPTVYEDFHQGLQLELALFGELFREEVSIISLHRPNAFFREFDAPIFNIEHTYQSKYFRDIKYFADSTGIWRFGHPFDSAEFKERRPLHILIHPVWWMLEGEQNLDKLRTFYDQKVESLKTDFSNNCIPFRSIHESL